MCVLLTIQETPYLHSLIPFHITIQSFVVSSPTPYCNISMRFLPLLGGLLPLLGLVGAAPSCNHECNRACWTSRFIVNTDYENEWPVTGVTRKVRFSKLCTRLAEVSTCSHGTPQFDFEITEVDEWVGPDGHIKKGAMLINGEIQSFSDAQLPADMQPNRRLPWATDQGRLG